MPAASSDLGFLHDSSLEDLPTKKDEVSSIRYVDPGRISYFPIHTTELRQLRDTLGPDEEAIAASQNPEFKIAEFYASQFSNPGSQAISIASFLQIQKLIL